MNFGFSTSRLKKKPGLLSGGLDYSYIIDTLLTQILDICSFGGGFMRLFGRKRLFLIHMKEKYYIFTSLK